MLFHQYFGGAFQNHQQIPGRFPHRFLALICRWSLESIDPSAGRNAQKSGQPGRSIPSGKSKRRHRIPPGPIAVPPKIRSRDLPPPATSQKLPPAILSLKFGWSVRRVLAGTAKRQRPVKICYVNGPIRPDHIGVGALRVPRLRLSRLVVFLGTFCSG